MRRIIFLIGVFVFGSIVFSQSDPLPPTGNTVLIRTSGDENYKTVVKQFEKILDGIYEFDIQGEFLFSGEYLKNKNFPRTQRVVVTPGKNPLPITALEGLILLRDNPALMAESFDIVCLNSLYDRDGYGPEYKLNRHPAIRVDASNRIIQLTVGPEITGEDPTAYPVAEPVGYTPDDSPSRIVRQGQEYQSFSAIGSNTEVYSPERGDYVTIEDLLFGWGFANNWQLNFSGHYKNRNDQATDSSFTEQAGRVSLALSQTDALVEVGGGLGQYIVENPTLSLYNKGLFGWIMVNGVWIPRKEVHFSGDIEINLTSRNNPNPKPASGASAAIRINPYPFDILSNGHTNNYGLGTKADLRVRNGLAIENVAVFGFVGTKLVSARFPPQELALGMNYNTQTKKFGPYVGINFNLAIR